jgi:hypothetical protein
MRVVEVEAVAQHGVGERGRGCGQSADEPDHGGLGFSAVRIHRGTALDRHVDAVRGEAASEGVEEMELRRLYGFRRDLVVGQR